MLIQILEALSPLRHMQRHNPSVGAPSQIMIDKLCISKGEVVFKHLQASAEERVNIGPKFSKGTAFVCSVLCLCLQSFCLLWCVLHSSCVSDFPCVCFRDCVAWCWQSADPQFVEKRSLGGPACWVLVQCTMCIL